MKTMNIPDRILEEIHLGERNAEDYYDIYGKEQLENVLKQLDQSDEEILSHYSADAMRNAVLKKQFSVTGGTSGDASGEENDSSEKKIKSLCAQAQDYGVCRRCSCGSNCCACRFAEGKAGFCFLGKQHSPKRKENSVKNSAVASPVQERRKFSECA